MGATLTIYDPFAAEARTPYLDVFGIRVHNGDIGNMQALERILNHFCAEYYKKYGTYEVYVVSRLRVQDDDGQPCKEVRIFNIDNRRVIRERGRNEGYHGALGHAEALMWGDWRVATSEEVAAFKAEHVNRKVIEKQTAQQVKELEDAKYRNRVLDSAMQERELEILRLKAELARATPVESNATKKVTK